MTAPVPSPAPSGRSPRDPRQPRQHFAETRRHEPIEGPVHYHATDNDGAKEHLAAFCSGDPGDPDAAEVDKVAVALADPRVGIAREAVRLPGGLVAIHAAQLGPQTVILLHDQNETRLGFASIEIEDPEGDFGTFINVYGRERIFKGRPLADSTTTLGDALVRAVIEESRDATPGDDAPALYALTRPTNTLSNDVLQRLEFELQDGQPAVDDAGAPCTVYTFPSGRQLKRAQQLWRRRAGLGLPHLPEEVYLGRLPLHAPQATRHDLGRNDPCHCGSGKKYKRCHGA